MIFLGNVENLLIATTHLFAFLSAILRPLLHMTSLSVFCAFLKHMIPLDLF